MLGELCGIGIVMVVPNGAVFQFLDCFLDYRERYKEPLSWFDLETETIF